MTEDSSLTVAGAAAGSTAEKNIDPGSFTAFPFISFTEHLKCVATLSFLDGLSQIVHSSRSITPHRPIKPGGATNRAALAHQERQ